MKHILEPNELDAIRELVKILAQNYYADEKARISFTKEELLEAVELAAKIERSFRY